MTTFDRRSTLGLLAAAPIAARAAPLAQGKPVQLKVGDALPRFDLVQPGVRNYLISTIKDGRQIAGSIWRREITLTGKDLRITQHWDGVGPTAPWIERDSHFTAGSFAPSSHTRITNNEGKRTVEGFLFGPRGITGLPDLPDNTQAAFNVPSDEPMYNFETDMEMLQALPWAAGYAVSIPFFHPAPTSKPARYLWQVGGEEALPGPDGRGLPCWIVTCDYNTGGAPTRFWLAKTTHQLIKMEGAPTDGTVRRKTLLW